MLQFASKLRTDITFPFNKTFDKEKVLREIKGAEYTSGTTNLEAALELATKSFDADDGARPGLAKQVQYVAFMYHGIHLKLRYHFRWPLSFLMDFLNMILTKEEKL